MIWARTPEYRGRNSPAHPGLWSNPTPHPKPTPHQKGSIWQELHIKAFECSCCPRAFPWGAFNSSFGQSVGSSREGSQTRISRQWVKHRRQAPSWMLAERPPGYSESWRGQPLVWDAECELGSPLNHEHMHPSSSNLPQSSSELPASWGASWILGVTALPRTCLEQLWDWLLMETFLWKVSKARSDRDAQYPLAC